MGVDDEEYYVVPVFVLNALRSLNGLKVTLEETNTLNAEVKKLKSQTERIVLYDFTCTLKEYIDKIKEEVSTLDVVYTKAHDHFKKLFCEAALTSFSNNTNDNVIDLITISQDSDNEIDTVAENSVTEKNDPVLESEKHLTNCDENNLGIVEKDTSKADYDNSCNETTDTIKSTDKNNITSEINEKDLVDSETLQETELSNCVTDRMDVNKVSDVGKEKDNENKHSDSCKTKHKDKNLNSDKEPTVNKEKSQSEKNCETEDIVDNCHIEKNDTCANSTSNSETILKNKHKQTEEKTKTDDIFSDSSDDESSNKKVSIKINEVVDKIVREENVKGLDSSDSDTDKQSKSKNKSPADLIDEDVFEENTSELSENKDKEKNVLTDIDETQKKIDIKNKNDIQSKSSDEIEELKKDENHSLLNKHDHDKKTDKKNRKSDSSENSNNEGSKTLKKQERTSQKSRKYSDSNSKMPVKKDVDDKSSSNEEVDNAKKTDHSGASSSDSENTKKKPNTKIETNENEDKKDKITVNKEISKPILKCISLDKLLDPKIVANKNKSKNMDITVIVLSSSDSDEKVTKTSKNKSPKEKDKKNKNSPKKVNEVAESHRVEKSRSRNTEDKIQKNKKEIVFDSSSEDSDNSTIIARRTRGAKGRETKKRKKRSSDSDPPLVKRMREKFEELKNARDIQLRRRKQINFHISSNSSSDSSSSSVSSANDSVKRAPVQKKGKEREKKEKNIESLNLSEDYKNDIKFKSRCYVSLPKFSNEELIKKYTEKLEEKNISSLINLKSLKRNRHQRRGSSDSSASSTKKEKKRAKVRKEKKKKSTSDKSDSDKGSFKSLSSDSETEIDGVIPSDLIPNNRASSPPLFDDSTDEENNSGNKSSNSEIDKSDLDASQKKKEKKKISEDVNDKLKKDDIKERKKMKEGMKNIEDKENEKELIDKETKTVLDPEDRKNTSDNEEEKTKLEIDKTLPTEEEKMSKTKVKSSPDEEGKSDNDDKTPNSENEELTSKNKNKKISSLVHEDQTSKDTKSDSKANEKNVENEEKESLSENGKSSEEGKKPSENEKSSETKKDTSDTSSVEKNSTDENKKISSDNDEKLSADETSKKNKSDNEKERDSSDENHKESSGKKVSSDNEEKSSDDEKSSSKAKIDNEAKESSSEKEDEKSSQNKTNKLHSDNKEKTSEDEISTSKTTSDNEEKNQSDKKADKNKSSSESDSENSKDGKKSKDKKKWRADKLLRTKLKESDSEEELIWFRKKKKKLAEEEEDKKSHSKRHIKRKTRRLGSESNTSSESEDDKNKSDSSDAFKKKSSNSSDSEIEKKKKVRKRIKRVKDSEESSDEDRKKGKNDDDEEKPSTRKKIRNVWNRDSLADTTKAAAKEEELRKKRISERQKLYNQIYTTDESINATVEKVVLDFNEETKEELLTVHPELVKKLKPHQAKGVQFMWTACFESIERTKTTEGSGCILAHCMGLGKTLQVITLIHTLITNFDKTGIRTVMVVCPLSTVLNWVSEFKKWLDDIDGEQINVFDLVSQKQARDRVFETKDWQKFGGVLVIGYDMFRNLSNPNAKRLTKKVRTAFSECFVDPGPDLVVCDEGHLLKNEKTGISIAMNRIKSKRRIVLTGTPLQNNLKEYFCMVHFVKPSLLGTYKEYLNRFVNPITNGQYTDSTALDIQIMRKRSHVLHKMLDGVVERRDYSVLAPFLPPKHEYILFVTLTAVQVELYKEYLTTYSRNSSSKGTSYLFHDFQEFQRICIHPRVLLDKSNQDKIRKEKEEEDESEGSLKDFIDDDDDDEDSAKSTSSDETNSNSENENGNTSKKKSETSKRRTRANPGNEKSDPEEEVEQMEPENWWAKYCPNDELDNMNTSSKIVLLFEILHQCELIGDKVLVFSQSLYSLNLIEYFLNKIDEATQRNERSELIGNYQGSWSLGLDYFRLDGQTSCDKRAAWCKVFNNENNTRARLFLISTRAGGLGINLFAANRVVIFDVSWNPSHDIQSIYRVYRFGQTKPCYIYRFVTFGTMENKIYERQVTKQAISKRVIDEQQIDRHYNQNDLTELYIFNAVPTEERPIPMVPKDRLFADLLQSHDKHIYKYHEHNSLLENKEDEVLNEEERKAAWEEFENEKKAIPKFDLSQMMFKSGMHETLRNILQKDPSNANKNAAEMNTAVFSVIQQIGQQVAAGDFSMYRRLVEEHERRVMIQKNTEMRYQQLLQQQYNPQQNMVVNPVLLRNPQYMQMLQQRQQFPQASVSSVHSNLAPPIPSEIVELDD